MDEEKQPTQITEAKSLPQVRFEYIKSNLFRVIHVDGAIGGLTPSGNIHMAVFNERLAIPQQIVIAVNPNGTLGGELKESRVVREGVIREMDADLMMDLPTAKSILKWLKENIEKLENTQKAALDKLKQAAPAENQVRKSE